MKFGRALQVCALSILLAACATHSTSRADKRAEESAAHSAALKWLRLLDDGDYEQAFEWEAQDFRIYQTQAQFVRSMKARRAPFGRTLSRLWIGAVHLEKLVGLPKGNYESIIFKTAFENKSPTVERVILLKQSAGWRVIDYRIY
jgi:Protein of unknown function (DUF4019)